MKPVEPLVMWAAISEAGPRNRTRWIHTFTVRRLRRDARAAYLENWTDHRAALSYVTFERVEVRLAEAA